MVAIAVLAGFASGAALSRSSGVAATVTLDSAKFSGRWREGWLVNGTVRISGTVDAAAQLQASVRPKARAGKPTKPKKVEVPSAGRYSATVKLLRRPLPGVYVVTVTGQSGGRPLNKAQRDFTVPTPHEGVVGTAEVSARRGGPGVDALPRSTRKAWARFHFLTPPPGTRTVTVQWKTPASKLICQKTPTGPPVPKCTLELRLPPSNTIDTFIRSSPYPLTQGNWYVRLSVGGRLAKQVFVRIR